MDNDNVIPFEEYRKKKMGSAYQKDMFSEMFSRDLRDQPEMIAWYEFNKAFHKYRLFVHTLFFQNHMAPFRTENPNSGFVACFNESQMKDGARGIFEAVAWEKRKPIMIDAAHKTYRQLAEQFPEYPIRYSEDVHGMFREILLTSDKVMVVVGLSKLKVNKFTKIGIARSLIKILDDAHFENITPRSDLIFVDFASFLQDAWDNIGIYLNILA
jgi:hypothetical protein